MVWSIVGCLHLCHLGVKTGAGVSTNQGCPGVYNFVAAWVGQPGMVWAKGPGFTEAAGQLGCQTVHWSVLSR